MTILEFAHQHVFLAFCGLLIIGQLLGYILWKLPNRIIRHMNLRKNGWPPIHLDLDGDWKPEPKESDDES